MIAVDSALRDLAAHPLPNDFRVFFANPLRDVEQVELLSASVPIVADNVDGADATFAWEEVIAGGDGAPVRREVLVPSGHYDETVLATLSPPRLVTEAEDEIETETEVVGEGEGGEAAGEGGEGDKPDAVEESE